MVLSILLGGLCTTDQVSCPELCTRWLLPQLRYLKMEQYSS